MQHTKRPFIAAQCALAWSLVHAVMIVAGCTSAGDIEVDDGAAARAQHDAAAEAANEAAPQPVGTTQPTNDATLLPANDAAAQLPNDAATEPPSDAATTESPNDAATTEPPNDAATTEPPNDAATTEPPNDAATTEPPNDAEVPSPTASRITYVGLTTSLVDGASYTFDAVNLGTPAADRTIVVATHSATNVALQYNVVRIGNVEAQKVVSEGEGVGPSLPVALFVASFPQGSSGTIRVEMSASPVRCAIAIYAVYGLSSTVPLTTAKTSASKNVASFALDVPAGGVAVSAVNRAGGSTTSSAVWTGMEERYDAMMVEAGGTPTLVSGGSLASPIQTIRNVKIDATPSSPYVVRAVAASFR